MARKVEYTGKYKLDKFEFGFAKWYSLQYNRWLLDYKSLNDSVKAINYGEAVKGGIQSDPTEKLATKKLELTNKMLKIENAAYEAGGEIAQYILMAVTNEDVTFDILEAKYKMPCCRTLFYEKRRKYYWLLAQEI